MFYQQIPPVGRPTVFWTGLSESKWFIKSLTELSTWNTYDRLSGIFSSPNEECHRNKPALIISPWSLSTIPSIFLFFFSLWLELVLPFAIYPHVLFHSTSTPILATSLLAICLSKIDPGSLWGLATYFFKWARGDRSSWRMLRSFTGPISCFLLNNWVSLTPNKMIGWFFL